MESPSTPVRGRLAIQATDHGRTDGARLTASVLAGARVAVVGLGWYGGHTALALLDAGADVTVFEAADAPFTGASGHNQNRLHQGFHYPRSHVTREQSRRGFRRFELTYPHLSRPIERNLFAIAERDSLIDFETYVDVMRAAGLRFRIEDLEATGLTNVTGVISCEERLIDTAAAAAHFRDALDGRVRFGSPVTDVTDQGTGVTVDGERFDAAVLCTWGTFTRRADWDLYYEPCVSLIYEALQPDEPAITMASGVSGLRNPA